MEPLKIGILGAGSISATMVQTIAQMEAATACAVAARDGAKAEAFAGKYGVAKHYGSYEAMLADPDVELVYVATPHSHHYEHVKLCLEAGKPALCEKSFTVNAVQAQELVDLARQKKLYLAEAIWTRYLPISKTIRRLVEDGAVGRVTGLTANLGYDIKDIERMYTPALAGGALLDVGVYTLNFALMTLGNDYDKIASDALIYHTGVDAQDCITLQYPGDIMAVLYASMMSNTDRKGIVYGENGHMEIDNINNPQSVKIYGTDRELKQEHKAPPQISGYEYEIIAAVKALRAGEIECTEMPHQETVRVMQIMDGLRQHWGVRYPELE